MDVRTICLGLLSLADRSGYEIKKLLEEGPLGHFVEASFGSIYPALTRMAEDGLVEYRTEEQDGRPDKKTYSITERGRAVFRSALEGPIGPDRHRSDFMFVLMFADQLSADRLSGVIDERLAYYENQIAEIKQELSCDTATGPRFVAGHAIAILEAAKAYLEQNRHLIEQAEGHDVAEALAARAD
jgi:DNA-binding PadR family transcriptional regulator